MPERIINLGPNHRIIVDDVANTWRLQFFDTLTATWKDIMAYKTDTQLITRLLKTAELSDDIITPAKLAAVKFGTVTIDPPSIPATSTANVDVAVAGLLPTDLVIAEPQSNLEHGLVHTATYVPAAGTLRVRITNWTGLAIDGVARTWLWVRFRAS